MSPRRLSKKRSMPKTPEERSRAHVEKMLLRARLKASRAAKLVAKWEERLAATRRARVNAQQAVLWSDQDWNTETESKPCCASRGNDETGANERVFVGISLFT
jgi:hypothetical protein